MKAEELMIDDWVMNKYQKRVFQILNVGENHVGEKHNDGMIEGHKEQYLEPIPLTRKILEKNGWQSVDGICASVCRHDVYNLSILHWAKPGVNLTINKGGYGHNFVCMPIEYVHQLQHALRLCGVDKEIVL